MNPVQKSFTDQLEVQVPKATSFFVQLFESAPAYTPEPFFEKFDDYFRELAVALIEHDFIDLELAEKITDVLKELLVLIDNFSADHQLLVYGAAQYFLESDDAVADKASPEGLKDDIAIINLVLETIGRSDLAISN